jgi:hypothetical protein
MIPFILSEYSFNILHITALHEELALYSYPYVTGRVVEILG